jgi:hypothetical protein
MGSGTSLSELGDDAERALGADEPGDEVVAGDALGGAAAAAQHLAAHQRDLEAEDVLAGDAVLERARPAGVGRRVAADRAELERRRVRRIEHALGLDRLLQPAGDHAGLDDRHQVAGVDLLDPHHALGRQHDAAVHRQRAAAHAAARAARRDRHLALEADPQHGGGLLGGLDEHRALRREELRQRALVATVVVEPLVAGADHGGGAELAIEDSCDVTHGHSLQRRPPTKGTLAARRF